MYVKYGARGLELLETRGGFFVRFLLGWIWVAMLVALHKYLFTAVLFGMREAAATSAESHWPSSASNARLGPVIVASAREFLLLRDACCDPRFPSA